MPEIDPPFRETSYLHANPDVAAAVAAGKFRSGYNHWKRFGRREGRLLSPPIVRPSRRDILLGGLDICSAAGLEIGALTAPLVTKTDGNIHYVDHADTDTLRLKYPLTEIDHDKLVDVDFVWGERSLQDCLGPDHRVDYVLASHVIEHVPDLVTWLQEIASILRPGGELRLAIPDRRYTFDILRRESVVADALDAFIRRARAPLPRAILDHFLNVTEIDTAQAWRGELDLDKLQPTHPPAFALSVAEQFLHSGQYQDTHCWVFTPKSFAILGCQLAQLGILHLSCINIYPTEPMELEFFARLRFCPDPAECLASWHAEANRLAVLDSAAPSRGKDC